MNVTDDRQTAAMKKLSEIATGRIAIVQITCAGA